MYRLTASREIYRNPWIRVREDRVVRPDGGEGLFGVVEGKPGSAVLAVNDQREVYLVKEYKYGIGRESIEVMSGGIEPGESPLDAARRELKEEIGLEASEWIEIGRIDPFTTIVDSPNYLFIARGIEEGEHRREPGETLEIMKVPEDEALAMVFRGEITHAASCVLLLRYFADTR